MHKKCTNTFKIPGTRKKHKIRQTKKNAEKNTKISNNTGSINKVHKKWTKTFKIPGTQKRTKFDKYMPGAYSNSVYAYGEEREDQKEWGRRKANLPVGFAAGSVVVQGVLEGRPGEDGGEAIHVAEELQGVRHGADGVLPPRRENPVQAGRTQSFFF